MRPWLFLVLFSLALLFAQPASAQEEPYSVQAHEAGIEKVKSADITVRDDGRLYVVEELLVRKGDVVRRVIPGRVDDITVLDSRGRNIPFYESDPEADLQLLCFFLEESGAAEDSIWIRYLTENLASRSGDVPAFAYSNYYTAGVTIVKLHFPPDSEVLSIEPKDLYRTRIKPSEIWLFPQEDTFYFTAKYRIKAPVSQQENNGFYAFFLWPAIAFIIVFAVYFFYATRVRGKKKQRICDQKANDLFEESSGTLLSADTKVSADKRPRRVKASVMNMLDDKESKVVKLLEESDSEITQAYVYKSTLIPKTSLSDVIRRLAKRNLIEYKREGRTNWIKLKEWVFE